jgi:hypothetical protein
MTAVSYFSAKSAAKMQWQICPSQRKALPFALSSCICRERKREKTLEGDDLWNNFLSESGSFQIEITNRNEKQMSPLMI